MQQRQIGKTGRKISAIGIGAMSFTNFYGETSENQSHNILKTALDHGVNHIDTANVYGNGLAEQVIGNFLSQQGTQKDKMFHIATTRRSRMTDVNGTCIRLNGKRIIFIV